MKTRKTIKQSWSDYDKTIAQSHLNNFGVIFLDDQYNLPIDNLFELEELYQIYKKEEKKGRKLNG